MSDLIERQAAIDILDAFEVKIENGEEFAYSWARMRLTELPSAQPERKKGEWEHGEVISRSYIGNACVGIDYDGWRCGVCGSVVEQPYKPIWKFCPHCGADMRGESDET